MKCPRSLALALALTTLALTLAPTAALADAFPSKPVRMVVPFAAGGATDVQARLLARELQKGLGQPVVVENKPGANGAIGVEEVAGAAPDGHVLLMGGIGPNAAARAFPPAPRVDPIAALIPVAMTAVSANVLVVHPGFAARSLEELIALSRKQPGKFDYASPGAGTSNHLAMELLKQRAKIDIATVPYKGSAPAMNDVIGGQLPMMFNNIDVVLPHVRAGKLRALAITGDSRSPLLPDVPTMAEAGVPDFATGAWFGLFAPKGTPAAVVQRIHDETQKALDSPEMKQRYEAMGIQPGRMSQPAFAEFVAADSRRWAKLVQEAGLRAE